VWALSNVHVPAVGSFVRSITCGVSDAIRTSSLGVSGRDRPPASLALTR